ncbi:MAG: prephenate dehydrogenase/arogenate dehydrogenase family protein [Xanthomonadaceae bacterium]|nr:prephenate dehydrogenase/arogenate dehydrogenase family protein [Rhodospirillaceae bacterium]NIA17911.1 prephenate dehydrogenase/arogenate dehydrogenase family protein [Xanthomonadaceae bacterium]
MSSKKPKIAIIGFGRFGKLLAEILASSCQIFIISQKKIKNKNFQQIDYPDLKNIDIIIPAVPISFLKNMLKKISPFLKNDSLVMDVCSVKVYPCKWLKKYLPENIEILGSHPMFGPDSAKKGLAGLQIIFCPLRISSERFKAVKNIFEKLDLKIIEMTPEKHDKQSAVSLALVHFIGRGLEKIKINKQKISTLGFEKLLQVCDNVTNDSWELFYDMNNYNPYAKKVRKKFIKSLQKINLEIGLNNRKKNINKKNKFK